MYRHIWNNFLFQYYRLDCSKDCWLSLKPATQVASQRVVMSPYHLPVLLTIPQQLNHVVMDIFPKGGSKSVDFSSYDSLIKWKGICKSQQCLSGKLALFLIADERRFQNEKNVVSDFISRRKKLDSLRKQYDLKCFIFGLHTNGFIT